MVLKKLVLIILFPIQLIFCQNQLEIGDSLLSQGIILTDSSYEEQIAKKAFALIQTNQEASKAYATYLLDRSRRNNDSYWMGRANNLLGIISQIQGNYKTADSLYHDALNNLTRIDSSVWIAHVYNNLGLLESARGRFDAAIINYFKTLDIRENINDSTGMAGALNKIGKAYFELSEYEKAKGYYQEALDIHHQYNPEGNFPFLILNLGHCHLKLGNKQYGQQLVDQADSLFTKSHNLFGLGDLHFVKGELYGDQNQIDQALIEYNQALFYFQSLGNKREIAKTQLAKSELLFELEQTQKAITTLDSALLTSYLIGATDIELKALMFQAFLRAQLGHNYNRAILYKRYIKLSDSLNAVKQMEDLARAENTYLVEQREKELRDLSEKEKISRIKVSRNRLIAIILGLLVLAVVFYSLIINRQIRTIKKLNHQLKSHQGVLESEVRIRTKELEEAMEKVVQSDKLKSYFLANLSHEIRTPLNSILGFSDILADTLDNKPGKKYIDEIGRSGEQLLEIIDRILQLSKFQSGSIRAYTGVFEPRSRLLVMEQEVQKLSKESGHSVDVKMELHIPHNHPILIKSDPDLINQVLINLIHNALKFTKEGVVKYGMVVKERQVEFFVEDTGIGIKSDDLVKVFTPFDQVEDVLTKSHRGVGLGLPLSAQIIDLLDSKLNVESEPEKGSRFSFRFDIFESAG